MTEWFSAVTTTLARPAAARTAAESSGLMVGTLMTETDTPCSPRARAAARAAASIMPLANRATSVPGVSTSARPRRST